MARSPLALLAVGIVTAAGRPADPPRLIPVDSSLLVAPAAVTPTALTADDRLARGRNFADRGEHLYAVGEFDAATRLAPGRADILVARAASYVAMLDPDRAHADLDAVARLGPPPAEAHRLRAQLHFDDGWYPAAVRAADAGVRADPTDHRLFRGRAECRAALGESGKAVADFTRALRLVPGDSHLLYRRAEELFRLGEVADALADLDRALSDPPARFRRAEFRIAAGRPADALADLDLVAAAWTAHRDTAVGLPSPPRPDQAKPCESPRLAPALPRVPPSAPQPPLVNASGLMPTLGSAPRPVTTAEFLRPVPSDGPALPPVEVQMLRAKAHDQLGEAALAETLLTDVLDRDPGNHPARQLRAVIRYRRAEFTSAETDLTAVLATVPGDAGAWAARAVCRVERGDLAGAEADLAEADRLDPDLPLVSYGRGRLFWRRGDVAAAGEQFGTAARRNPADVGPLAARAHARLLAGDCSGAAADLTFLLWRFPPVGVRVRLHLGRAAARAGLGDFLRAADDVRWAAVWAAARGLGGA